MYEVHLSQNAQKFLDKLDSSGRERIKERLKKLLENPFTQDSKFIGRENNEKIFRYRIGDYRALYKLKDSLKIVLITKIDKKPKVYD